MTRALNIWTTKWFNFRAIELSAIDSISHRALKVPHPKFSDENRRSATAHQTEEEASRSRLIIRDRGFLVSTTSNSKQSSSHTDHPSTRPIPTNNVAPPTQPNESLRRTQVNISGWISSGERPSSTINWEKLRGSQQSRCFSGEEMRQLRK